MTRILITGGRMRKQSTTDWTLPETSEKPGVGVLLGRKLIQRRATRLDVARNIGDKG